MPTQKVSLTQRLSGLETFLKAHKASKGGTFTHTSISGGGAYYIDPTSESDNNEFFEKYYDHVFDKELQAHLTEGIRDCDVTPVKIDLDFRQYQDTTAEIPERAYKMEDIIKVCQLYMSVMEEWLVSPDPHERYCFILEKPNARYDYDKKGEIKVDSTGKRRVKDGVHIMFPYICTKTFLQLEFRSTVYKQVEKSGLFQKYNYAESCADIFDKAVIDRNNWQMYGSNKGKEFETYMVSKIIEVYSDRTEDIPCSKYTSKELVKLLSVRNRDEAAMIQYEKLAIIDENEEKQNAINSKKNKYSAKSKTTKNKTTKEDLKLICGDYNKKIGKFEEGYMDCISQERAHNYDSWIEVGWALHNIDNTTHGKINRFKDKYPESKEAGWCDNLFRWHEWGTQPGTGYESENIETYKEVWDTMRCDGLSIGSLKLWAKEDSKTKRDRDEADNKTDEYGNKININTPTQYEKIRDDDLGNHIFKAKGKNGGTSFDVAKVVYECYKHDFVCISIKDKLWYYYDEGNHKWVEDDKGIRLKMKLSTEIFSHISKYASKITPVDADDPQNEVKTQLQKTASRLKDTSFKNNIMTECEELFYDKSKEFYNKLDSNMNLIGFKNGVYDLANEEFRRGRPEDYITMSTGIDFTPFDANSAEIKGIDKFLSDILTISSVKDYVVKLMATFLCGSTKSEKFHVWSGSGGNGKSKLIELLEKSLGDYAGKMNISNLTQKRGNAGAANPELARTKGKRFINLQEPDEHCKLNVGLMKEMTGGDKVIARALFKEPIEFKPQFKMVLTCNDKPELPPDDDGTWRRVVLVQYSSKFKHDPLGTWVNKYNVEISTDVHKEHVKEGVISDKWVPASTDEPQFPIDESLNEMFGCWAEPFMSLLIHKYIEFKNDDLREPPEVIEYTNIYRDQNNHFKEFINDKVIPDPTGTSIIRIEDLHNEYKIWYKDTQGAQQGAKKRQELKLFMEKEYGEYHPPGIAYPNRGWKGLKIQSPDIFLEDSHTDTNNDVLDNIKTNSDSDIDELELEFDQVQNTNSDSDIDELEFDQAKNTNSLTTECSIENDKWEQIIAPQR